MNVVGENMKGAAVVWERREPREAKRTGGITFIWTVTGAVIGMNLTFMSGCSRRPIPDWHRFTNFWRKDAIYVPNTLRKNNKKEQEKKRKRKNERRNLETERNLQKRKHVRRKNLRTKLTRNLKQRKQ